MHTSQPATITCSRQSGPDRLPVAGSTAPAPAGVTAAAEIRRLHSEIVGALRTSVEKAIRIGALLTEQKARLPHGSFETWIEKECGFTSRTGRNYMRLFDRRDRIASASDLSGAYALLTEGAKTETVSVFNPLSPEEQEARERCENKIRDGLAALASIKAAGGDTAVRYALDSLRAALPDDMGWIVSNLSLRWNIPPAPLESHGEGGPPGYIPPNGNDLTVLFRNAIVNVHPATEGGFHVCAINGIDDNDDGGECHSTRRPVRAEVVELCARFCLGLGQHDRMPDAVRWAHKECDPAAECSPFDDEAEHRAERLHHSFPNKHPPPEGAACTCAYCQRSGKAASR